MVANRHHERHVASLECEEGSSDDDAPLARLLQPSTAFTISDEGRSSDSDDCDEHRPPRHDRPRRRTKPPDKLEYDMPGKPAWHYQHCVSCGAPPTRGYRY